MSLENRCLKVRHHGEAKVVGKIAVVDGQYVFYHAHTGSQKHISLDALAIDVVVVQWLRTHKIGTAHYYDKQRKSLRIAKVEDFVGFKAIRKSWGNRDRYYLPIEFWQETKRWYPEPPWAPLEIIVGE